MKHLYLPLLVTLIISILTSAKASEELKELYVDMLNPNDGQKAIVSDKRSLDLNKYNMLIADSKSLNHGKLDNLYDFVLRTGIFIPQNAEKILSIANEKTYGPRSFTKKELEHFYVINKELCYKKNREVLCNGDTVSYKNKSYIIVGIQAVPSSALFSRSRKLYIVEASINYLLHFEGNSIYRPYRKIVRAGDIMKSKADKE